MKNKAMFIIICSLLHLLYKHEVKESIAHINPNMHGMEYLRPKMMTCSP